MKNSNRISFLTLAVLLSTAIAAPALATGTGGSSAAGHSAGATGSVGAGATVSGNTAAGGNLSATGPISNDAHTGSNTGNALSSTDPNAAYNGGAAVRSGGVGANIGTDIGGQVTGAVDSLSTIEPTAGVNASGGLDVGGNLMTQPGNKSASPIVGTDTRTRLGTDVQ